MVSGPINWSGTLHVTRVCGRVDSEKYVKMSEDGILPVLRSKSGNNLFYNKMVQVRIDQGLQRVT